MDFSGIVILGVDKILFIHWKVSLSNVKFILVFCIIIILCIVKKIVFFEGKGRCIWRKTKEVLCENNYIQGRSIFILDNLLFNTPENGLSD